MGRYERHPTDAIHLGVALVLVAIGVVLATAGAHDVRDFERHLTTFATSAPRRATNVFVETVQLFALLVPLVGLILLLYLRSFRALLYSLVAGVATLAVTYLAVHAVTDKGPANYRAHLRNDGLIGSYAFPNTVYFATAVAVLTALSPFLNRAWRRVLWSALAIALFLRIITATTIGVHLVLGIAIGWAIGTIVLLVFGSPTWSPTKSGVEEAMARAGVPLASVAPADGAGYSSCWLGTARDGREVFVKVEGRDDRNGDLLLRMYRFVRAKNLDDQRPFASLRRAVEHEGFVSLAAANAGVDTPPFIAFASLDDRDDAFLLAHDHASGRHLDQVPAAEITDDLLCEVWRQLLILRDHRIAHRELTFRSIYLADDGRVSIVGFAHSELAATDRVLAMDVAQLLTASAIRVGVTRAVKDANAVVGKDVLAESLPLIQAAALSGATRKLLRESGNKDLVKDLQAEVQRVTGVEELHLEQLERIRPHTVLVVIALGIAIYVFYPQLADLSQTMQHIGDAAWGWIIVAIVFAFLTYVGAAMSMIASVPGRLPPWPTFLEQMASSFVNRITPASTGGFALNLRFMQREGIDPAVGVTGLGINAVGGFLIHVPLMLIFLFWAGQSGTVPIKTPDVRVFVYIAIGFALISVVILLVPKLRALIFSRGIKALRDARKGLVQVARDPAKLMLLLAGAFIVCFATILSLAASVQAYGGGLAFVSIAAAFLTGSIVGHLAPTPGGLGGMEAALFAALTVAGLNKDTALSSVFAFRLATFWIPILPGWLAFQLLRHRGEI